MKNKQGFTLIELLAVIVILAIIAVITVPKIADMISSSRQGGAEDSFYGALKAAELGYTKALQSNTSLSGDVCDFSKANGSTLTCMNGTVISFSGKIPDTGKLIINADGSASASKLTLNGYKCYGDLSVSNPCIKSETSIAANELRDKAFFEGDNLYLDKTDSSRYIYKGENPDNYLKFNNTLWRIISIEADNTIKIRSDQSIGKYSFDIRTTDTTGPRLNSNNTYCRLNTNGLYTGCNIYGTIEAPYNNGKISGTVKENSTLNKYLNTDYYNSLSQEDKDLIVSHNFNAGATSDAHKTLEILQTAEKSLIWKGKIGLISVSDYIKASTNKECNSDFSKYLWYKKGGTLKNDFLCSTENYLKISNESAYTINPLYDYAPLVIAYTSTGFVDNYSSYSQLPTHPALYLKGDTKLTGSGTEADPYIIKQN